MHNLEGKINPTSRTQNATTISYSSNQIRNTHASKQVHHLRTQNQRYRTNISKAKCIQSAEDLELIESDTECKRIEKLEIGLDDPYLEEEEEEE